MKPRKGGARKRYVDIRIFLDNKSVFFEGGRVDDEKELALQRIFEKEIFRVQLENGYIKNPREGFENE
jgi:hypothetical protein